MNDLKTFLRFYDPPALDASEREWRVWICYQLRSLRQGVNAAQHTAAEVYERLDARLIELDKDVLLNGRQLGRHEGRLRDLVIEGFELGQQIDATNTLLDTVGRAVGLDLFPDDPPPAPPAPEAKP